MTAASPSLPAGDVHPVADGCQICSCNEPATSECADLGGSCLPLTAPPQPTCGADELAINGLGCGQGLLGQSTTCCLKKKDQDVCGKVNGKYIAAVDEAKKCVPYPTFAAQCMVKATNSLSCGHLTYVNGQGDMPKYTDLWNDLECLAVGWLCPMYMPIPPTGGSCDGSMCQDVFN